MPGIVIWLVGVFRVYLLGHAKAPGLPGGVLMLSWDGQNGSLYKSLPNPRNTS